MQTLNKGALALLITGHDYVLAGKPLAKYLRQVGVEGTRYRPVVILERDSGVENHDYEELIVEQIFSSDQIRDLNLDGKRLLLMDNRYLFASPELKSELEMSCFDFHFSEGLSRFA